MQLSQFLGLTVAGACLTSAACPPRIEDGIRAGEDLAQWAQESINAFFPFQDGWQDAYDIAFSPDVYATFNATVFTFDTFKAAYESFYPLLNGGFAGTFEHGFLSAVGVPNGSDNGGFVTVTGWQGGHIGGVGGPLLNVTDAAYMIITETEDCERKIVEFRESSNLGKF
ncbi:hypothetical protein F5B22DRAFT_44290 [Xylaria bambusicola]|uniref:uncharacterized protein n=1 Tax=Xylaria bambusicola TaxID=326684 RepID=UPI0020080BFD|nr:uncharacterized protein F5B22DRAFT_44290 [Xylaria bambusicola]KAI0502833.1 hypothetical protein F5B22DRAFT_44290 [Xylaria bambusicola]